MNRKEVTVGFLWNFAFGLPNKLIIPILSIIIARILGPEEWGVFALLTMVLAITDVFRDAGLGHCYIADSEGEEPAREAGYHTLGVASAGMMAVAVLLSTDWLAGFFKLPQLSWGLPIVAAALFANGFTTIPVAKLNKQARFRDAGLVQTSATLISYGVALPLAFSGFGFKALVWSLLARSLLVWLLGHFAARVRLGRVSGEFARSVFKRSSSILAQNLMYSVYTILDKGLIAKLFGPAALGFYSIAWGLAIKPVEFVSFPLTSTLFVAYTKRSQDLEKFASVFCRSVAVAALATLPMFVYLGLFARELILVLYTSKFAWSIPLLQLLAIYFAFRSVGTLAGSALVAAQRAYWSVIAWAVGYLVVGLGLVLGFGAPIGQVAHGWAPSWGSLTLDSTVLWITAGACCSYALTLLFALHVLRPKRADVMKIVKSVLAASVPVAVCLALRQIPAGDVAILLIGIPVVGLVQLMMVGLIAGGSYRAAFSRGGLKKIWNSL